MERKITTHDYFKKYKSVLIKNIMRVLEKEKNIKRES